MWSRWARRIDPQRAARTRIDERALVELRGALGARGHRAASARRWTTWPGTATLRGGRWTAGVGARRTSLPPRRPRPSPRRRPAPDQRAARTPAWPWKSSGWNNNRDVADDARLLAQRGEVADAGRDRPEAALGPGRADLPRRGASPRRRRGACATSGDSPRWGMARVKAPGAPGRAAGRGWAGEPAVVEGVRGRVAGGPGAARPAASTGRAALLSPSTACFARPKRMDDVFESTTSSRCTSPSSSASWGYWAMPILYGDRLVGGARRPRRTEGRRVPGQRRPRGRAVRAVVAGAGGTGDRGPGRLAGPRVGRGPARPARADATDQTSGSSPMPRWVEAHLDVLDVAGKVQSGVHAPPRRCRRVAAPIAVTGALDRVLGVERLRRPVSAAATRAGPS